MELENKDFQRCHIARTKRIIKDRIFSREKDRAWKNREIEEVFERRKKPCTNVIYEQRISEHNREHNFQQPRAAENRQ